MNDARSRDNTSLDSSPSTFRLAAGSPLISSKPSKEDHLILPPGPDNRAEDSGVVDRIRNALAEYVQLPHHAGPKQSRKLAEELLLLLDDNGSCPIPIPTVEKDSSPAAPLIENNGPINPLLLSKPVASRVQIFDLKMNAKRKSPRTAYSKDKRKETHETRKRGACSKCKKQKKRCIEAHLEPRPPRSRNPPVLRPKPTEETAENSELPVQPIAKFDRRKRAATSGAEYQSAPTNVIHAPVPARQLPISFDVFNGHRLLPKITPAPEATSLPRRMTPEYPAISVSILRKRPSLQDIFSYQSPQQWSNYCRSYGNDKEQDLESFDFGEFLNSRGLDPQEPASTAFEQLASPTLNRSSGSEQAVIQAEGTNFLSQVNERCNPTQAQAGEDLPFQANFATISGLDHLNDSTDPIVGDCESQSQTSTAYTIGHQSRTSCGKTDCTCQTLSPCVPTDGFPDLFSESLPQPSAPSPGAVGTSAPRLKRSHSASNLSVPSGFMSGMYPPPSQTPLSSFAGDLISFEPLFGDLWSMPESSSSFLQRSAVDESLDVNIGSF